MLCLYPEFCKTSEASSARSILRMRVKRSAATTKIDVGRTGRGKIKWLREESSEREGWNRQPEHLDGRPCNTFSWGLTEEGGREKERGGRDAHTERQRQRACMDVTRVCHTADRDEDCGKLVERKARSDGSWCTAVLVPVLACSHCGLRCTHVISFHSQSFPPRPIYS